MTVNNEQIEPCTVELEITLGVDQVDKAFDRALRDYGQYTRVPGFRPGKAPKAVLERYVDSARLVERARELLAAPAYQEALKQEGIDPWGEPDVEFDDLAKGSDWRFKVQVPLNPIVEVGDMTGLSVERPIYDPQEKDVDEKVEEVRHEQGRLVKVEGRGVQEKDWLITESIINLEGEPEQTEPKRTLVRMGDNIPGFDEALLGAVAEETREFELTFPEDFQEPEKAGKKAKFKIVVANINERVLPEVTDEWVYGITGQESVAEWRKAILETLKASSKETSDEMAENRIVEEILKRSKIEYPKAMLDNDMRRDLSELEQELENRDTSYEDFLAANNISEDQHMSYVRSRADRMIRARLVLTELAKREKVSVTQDEIDGEFGHLIAEYDPSDRNVQRVVHDPRRRSQVANRLLQRKVRDLLFRIAAIEDKPVAED